MSDGEIFMLSKYFNIEPVETIAGEFPSALMMDLKNNGLLINRRPAQLGISRIGPSLQVGWPDLI